MDLNTFLRAFRPHILQVPFSEKLRSGLIAGIAILLLALALPLFPSNIATFLMLGSMAASATLLFAVPHSPMAQPWNLVGGHLISALIGWLCIVFIHSPVLAAACAVGTAIFLMYYLNCLHPPGAATALSLVLGSSVFLQHGWAWTMLMVGANALIFLVLGLVLNNLLPGRRYPMPQQPAAPHKPVAPVAISEQDIDWAVEHMGGMIDVSTEDLIQIFELAQQHALQPGSRTPPAK